MGFIGLRRRIASELLRWLKYRLEPKRSFSEPSIPEKKTEEKTALPDFEPPQWLIDHCVITCEEWKDTPDVLILRDHDASDETSASSKTQEQAPLPSSTTKLPVYEMKSIFFEQLLGLVKTGASHSVYSHVDSPKTSSSQLVENCIQLAPGFKTLPWVKERFMKAVVQHFAKTIGADLITLCRDDLEDLATYVPRNKEKGHYADDKDFIDTLFHADQGPFSSRQYKREPHLPPIAAVLSALDMKRSGIHDDQRSPERAPLILHLFFSMYDVDNDDFANLWLHLCHIVGSSAVAQNIMIIISIEDTTTWKLPGLEPIYIAPTRSDSQEELLRSHGRSELPTRNIRALQRAVRQRRASPDDAHMPLMEPYAVWQFLDSNAEARAVITEKPLVKNHIDAIAQVIGGNINADRITMALLRIEPLRQTLHAWGDLVDGFADDAIASRKWSNFPLRTQKAIREIQSYRPQDALDKFFWEQTFLDFIVDSKETGSSWSDIVIDPRVQKEIMEVIVQHYIKADTETSYGVLKKNRTGGALLYGPPGTGKTQLARALSSMSQIVVICASASEIEHSLIGDTPKAIRGLFNLGRLLSPSVIFIDEADSLFRSRSSTTFSSSHDRVMVNQFLTEMDGLVEMKNAPFVLLSTNLPQDLDAAVLRRVPIYLYLGFPSVESRAKIFDIFLREEILGADITTNLLAHMTSHYTGSDIRALCVRAATLCNTWVDAGDHKGKRLLTRELFEQVLKRSGSTVTKPAIASIRSFAKEHDHEALQKMKEFEVFEGLNIIKASEWIRSREPLKTIDEIDDRGSLDSAPMLMEVDTASQDPESSQESLVPHDLASSTVDSTENKHDPVQNHVQEDEQRPEADPSVFYRPLGNNRERIRVLTILPADSARGSAQISCTLEQVDLKDWTSEYRAFRDGLVEPDGTPPVLSARARSLSWNAHNQIIREEAGHTESSIDLAQLQITDSIRFPEYCDQPLENFGGLHDRYTWGDFIALSYVWGDRTGEREIRLNDHPFQVGTNLYSALVRLRDSYEVKSRGLKVWVDAVCINQNDNEERAVEVLKMNMIFSEALAVRGWLGEPPDELALELHEVRRALDKVYSDIKSHYNSIAARMSSVPIPPSLDETLELTRDAILDFTREHMDLTARSDENIAYARWVVLESLSQTAYWRRLWIIQEVMLASSLMFWFGDSHFSMLELLSLSRHPSHENDALSRKLERYVGKDKLTESSRILLDLDIRLRCLRWNETEPSSERDQFLASVIKAADANATDPRDKVYGILALLPPAISTLITPSYQSSFTWQECWTIFAKSCYQGEGSLSLLARSLYTPLSSGQIPTWAFDLSSPKSSHPQSSSSPDLSYLDISPDVLSLEHLARLYESNLGLEKGFYFSGDNRLLFCKGVLVDFVGSIAHESGAAGSCTEVYQSTFAPPTSMLPRPCDACARLSLVRSMSNNADLEPENGFTILDMPWISPELLHMIPPQTGDLREPSRSRINYDEFGVIAYDSEDRHVSCEDVVPWTDIFRSPRVQGLFHFVLHPNESFCLQGTALRDFFTSQDSCCKNFSRFNYWLGATIGVLSSQRLFQTKNGLMGTIRKGGVVGDRIAVLSDCDTPIILRPSPGRDTYEVIGSCFVDGLMKGEVAEMVNRGSLTLETLCLA